tara:strand:- start:491 stop:595 length:105 start_codon:yes stop_codon:yes gene_type:complete
LTSWFLYLGLLEKAAGEPSESLKGDKAQDFYTAL